MKKNLLELWAVLKQDRKKLLVSIIILAIAFAAYNLSGRYTDSVGASVSPDLVLDHFGPYNLNFIFVWLFVAVILVFLFHPMLYHPKNLHYVLNMAGFFVIIRSVFVSLTHLRVPYDAASFAFPGFLSFLGYTNDLFFSGHVGLPFLGFFIFKDYKWARYFMLASSIILGITVLLMHAHYSIDVFSAFFISYGIYKMGNWFFKK